jgi:Flp pilus assembly protein TadG
VSSRRQSGQATVELIGALPALLLVGLVIMQALAVGYASVLAGGAAEAGALAAAAGHDSRSAVRRALPGWSRADARVSVRGGRVRVRLRPPSPLRMVARRLEVTRKAVVELR